MVNKPQFQDTRIRPTNVTIPDELRNVARVLGDGNASRGIRIALFNEGRRLGILEKRKPLRPPRTIIERPT